MILKRFIILCLYALLGSLVIPSQSFCHSDPYGIVDTITVESKTIPAGGKVSVKVLLRNDEEITGLTVPLKYPADLLVFDSVSYASTRLEIWSVLRVSTEPSTASILFGGIAMNDPRLPIGYGAIAELFFHTAPGVEIGKAGVIDTAFLPPAGKYLLSTAQSTAIYPVFVAGKVTVGAANKAPEFEPVAAKLANEGETLSFAVRAVDPEGGSVHLSCGKLPPAAQFKDNGNGTGTFSWTIPYLGAGSSLGSPFVTSFVATDGTIAVQMNVPIEVININRPPQISISGTVTAHSGDSVFIPLVASDPDLESITFSSTNLPIGAEIHGGNPGYIIWLSSIADSGSHALDVMALDESGGTTHKEVAVQLLPTQPIELSMTNEQAFTNEVVTIPISLRNRVTVSGFRLLIQFDPTLLIPFSVSRDSVRTMYWYPFSYQNLNDGRLILTCRANQDIPGSLPLPPGDGAVAHLKFATCANPNYAGQYSRVEFKIIDSVDYSDNIIYQPDGSTIIYPQLDLTAGSVLIKKYDALVGDLNLNNIAMEIADAVYFTNYFLKPSDYPLNGVRWVNSDINQDGLPGTIGDLVYMLRILTGDVSKVAVTEEAYVEPAWVDIADGMTYRISGNAEIAAALITLKVADNADVSCQSLPALSPMEFQSARDGELVRILIYSTQGKTLTATGDDLFVVTGTPRAEIVSQEIVDANGSPISQKEVVEVGTLPEDFSLEQNCPNPFNPETMIPFTLGKTEEVSLSVYNCLGQRVRSLLAGRLPSGKHSLRFDGKDDSGAPLASGIYLYRLQVGDQQQTRKMVLLK